MMVSMRARLRSKSRSVNARSCWRLFVRSFVMRRGPWVTKSCQEALSERRGDVARVAKEASEETADQAGNWPPIVGVAGREAQREQVTAIVDHQLQRP
jgi:hypothetical protein